MIERFGEAVRGAVDAVQRRRSRPGSTVEVALATTVAAAVVLAVDVAWVQRWVLVLPVLPYLLGDLAGGERWRGLAHLGAWAGIVAALGLITGVYGRAPELVRVQAAVQYQDTVAFLDEGDGVLARPEDFITDHALDYVYVTAGAAFTGGATPLLMGCRQLLLVGWQWGAMARERGSWLMGLPPWSPVGAAGYAALLLGWGEVTGAYLARRRVRWTPLWRLVGVGTVLLGLHLLLRIDLAYPWLRWLR